MKQKLLVLFCVALLLGGCNGGTSSSISSSTSSAESSSTSSSGQVSSSSGTQPSTSSSSKSQGAPVTKTLNIHFDSGNNLNTDVYFFNGENDIPYIQIDKLIGYTPRCDTMCERLENGNYQFKNTRNESIATLDVSTGIIAYAERSKYLSSFGDGTLNYIDEFYTERGINKLVVEKSSYTAPSEYKVNIADYGFKPIVYEDAAYLPLDIPHILCSANSGTYYLNGQDDIYLIGDQYNKKDTITPKSSYSKAYYEYAYNKFMLQTELTYGLKGYSRTLRNNNTKTEYFKNGVLNTLLPLRNDIVNSSSLKDFDDKICQIFATYLQEGGHTRIRTRSFGQTDAPLPIPEVKWMDDLFTTLGNTRKNSPDVKQDGKFEQLEAYDTDSDGKKDIAYVSFDDFDLDDDPEEKTIGLKNLIGGANGANALYNRNSGSYDATKYDIKDVVIDLSVNGGGSVVAEGYLLSWLCDGYSKETLRGVNGKALSTYTYQFDINGDEKYDQKDYLPSDVNVYILTSNGTYSAANSLAYNSYLYNRESKTKQIKFMGMTSCGGACSVTDTLYLPTGFSYRTSANDTSIDPLNVDVCCEDGVKPDSGLELSLEGLFNRSSKSATNINSLIVSKRK